MMFGIKLERRRRIASLSLPIVGGMASQTLLNLVDIFMVSQLGAEAVAAVGFGGFVNFLAFAFVTGMSTGVQAMASRRKGEGRLAEMAVPLNGGLLLVAAIAVPLSVALILLAPSFFPLLAADAEVSRIGVPYLQARLVGMVSIGANFAFRGYWNGVDLSRLYLRTLIVMHVSNVIISYVLVFGAFGAPDLGATGAGIGTTASTFLGTLYYFVLARTHATDAGFLRGIPDRTTMVSMLRLSLPSGLQSLLYAAGITVLFAIVARVGTGELAAMNVLINISLVAFLPGLGLGLAAATLVGQALGRKDVDDAERWGWEVARVGVVVMFLLGVPMALFPRLILSAFFGDEPEALAVAEWPLRLAGMTVWTEAILTVLMSSIMGAGATRIALLVNFSMQWIVFLPVAYLLGPVLGFGLLHIWSARILYRFLEGTIYVVLWRKRGWARVNV